MIVWNDCYYSLIIYDAYRIPLTGSKTTLLIYPHQNEVDRTLMNAIIDALKLFYQTVTREKTTNTPPYNPDYLLAKNELLALFAPLTFVFYQETHL